MIASAVLQDMGIISLEDRSKIIDRSKIRRERTKTRKEFQKKGTTVIPGLYFDGRKDKTIKQVVDANEKHHRKIVTEEYISIISEPGSAYFAHVTPTNGSSKLVSSAIISCLDEKEVDHEAVFVVECDGTAVNTGVTGGVIRKLEESFGNPLQWLIFMLHFNELPLKHLFTYLDGSTSGPHGYAGPIGKGLVSCMDHLPEVFEPILLVGPLPTVDINDLSTD